MGKLSLGGSTLAIQPIQPEHNKLLKHFMNSYADGGNFKLQVTPKVEDVLGATRLISPGSYGLMAYLPGVELPVGTIYAQPEKLSFRDKLYQGVLLHNLAVHPHHRRQGIATALVNEIVGWSKQQFSGDNLLIHAFIQEGNIASQATFARVKAEFTGRYLVSSSLKTRPPNKALNTEQTKGELNVREVGEYNLSTLEKVSQALNQFYEGYDLYQPQTAKMLVERLATQELHDHDLKLFKYYIVERQSEILAGTGVFNSSALFEVRLVKEPRWFKIVNQLFKFLPQNGIFESKGLSLWWHKPGEQQAAMQLIEAVRKAEYNFTPNLIASFDATNPVQKIFGVSVFKPKSKRQLVLLSSSAHNRSSSRLLR